MNRTTIEWTDHTWNPVTGCTKVSQGCKNCYAETLTRRFGKVWGRRDDFKTIQLHEDRLHEPKGLKKPSKIFVCDMSDLFHEFVPFKFIDLVFIQMAVARQHTFQILTKRPERALEYFSSVDNVWSHPEMRKLKNRLRYYAYQWDIHFSDPKSWTWPLPNVWIGTSCEDQKAADERIPLLLQVPAAVRFLSCEPLLGPIDLTAFDSYRPLEGKDIEWRNPANEYRGPMINWVIAGGESGRNARPMHPDWVRSIRDQCKAAGVPFFFKQWGNYLPLEFDAQPPFRRFASVNQLIDGHAIDVIDPEDPLGKPGTFKGRRFMDAMEAIVFCDENNISQCDFLEQGMKPKFKALLDNTFHREFPKASISDAKHSTV